METNIYHAQYHDLRGNDVHLDENGTPYSIDRNTGEVIELATVYMRPGDVAYTKEAREARKQRIEREQFLEMIRKANQDCEKFVFANTAEEFAELSPASVVRLVVLSTYTDYNNSLRLDRQTPMKYENLRSILKIGRTAVQDFWREVSPMYVVEDGGNLILTDDGTFHRGELQNRDVRWLKIYHNAVRELYRAVDKSQHKHLGHIFKMMRYINVQHNILCLNPMEKERAHIIPITFGQFCEKAGYNIDQVNRLITYFMKIKFRVGDHEEHFCKFVANDKYLSHSWVFVNPHVMYSGTDPESVANFAVLSRCPNTDGCIIS